MRWLLVLALAAPQEERIRGPFSNEPDHLWNLLHRAAFTWVPVEGEGTTWVEPDPGHWPIDDRTHGLDPDLEKRLDEFLAKRGEALVRNPLQRAVFQRDLWTLFDALQPPELHFGSSTRGTLPSKDLDPLRKKLAAVMRRVALTRDEIRALPDPYLKLAEAKLHPAGPDAAKPETPFLPPDLLDPAGPWVCLGDATGRPLAIKHAAFFLRHSAFLVLLRLPGGREAATTFVESLPAAATGRDRKPLPAGSRMALVRRTFLLSDRGEIVPSPLTESIQLRAVPEDEGAGAVAVFDLRRGKLLAGKPDGLTAIGPADEDFPFVLGMGHGRGEKRIPVFRSCGFCHSRAGDGLMSAVVVGLSPIGTPPKRPTTTTIEKEVENARLWKEAHRSWASLREHWPRD